MLRSISNVDTGGIAALLTLLRHEFTVPERKCTHHTHGQPHAELQFVSVNGFRKHFAFCLLLAMNGVQEPREELRAAVAYLTEHGIESVLQQAVNRVALERPADPFRLLAANVMEHSKRQGVRGVRCDRVVHPTGSAIRIAVEADDATAACVVADADVVADGDTGAPRLACPDGVDAASCAALQWVGEAAAEALARVGCAVQHEVDAQVDAGVAGTARAAELRPATLSALRWGISSAACRLGAQLTRRAVHAHIRRIANAADKSEAALPLPAISLLSGSALASSALPLQVRCDQRLRRSEADPVHSHMASRMWQSS